MKSSVWGALWFSAGGPSWGVARPVVRGGVAGVKAQAVVLPPLELGQVCGAVAQRELKEKRGEAKDRVGAMPTLFPIAEGRLGWEEPREE